jgi:hypothetical protein
LGNTAAQYGRLLKASAIVGCVFAAATFSLSGDPVPHAVAVLVGTLACLVNLLWFRTVGEVIVFPERRSFTRLALTAAKPLATLAGAAIVLSYYSNVVLFVLLGFFSFLPGTLFLRPDPSDVDVDGDAGDVGAE